MLSIYVNDLALDLGPDFSITFNFKSPVFNETGSYSYPITIPFTPRNAGILNFKHRVENTGDPYQEFPCRILVNGRSMNGLFKCTIGNNLTYEGSIYAIDGDFYYSIQNKNLQNYDFGEIIFDPSTTQAIDWMNGCIPYHYPDRPCAFPEIQDDGYLDPMPDDPVDRTFNSYVDGALKVADEFSGKLRILIPFLYLKYVLKKLCDGLGYELDNQFFNSHTDFNKLVLFNCVNANDDPTPFINFFPYDINHLFFNYHLPFISVTDFIKGIENYWNLKFFFNSTTHTVRIISLNNIIKDSASIEFSKNILSKSVEPEEQIKGFQLSMGSDEGDGSFDAMNKLESSFLDKYNGSVDKLTDLPVWPGVNPLELRSVIETGLIYQMVYKTWQPYQTWDLFSKYFYGDGKITIETKFSTLIEELIGDEYKRVTCKNSRAAWNKISPRVFFIRNWVVFDTPVSGNSSTDNFTLWYRPYLYYYTVDNGIFALQFKDYLKWRRSTKLIKTTKQMDWSEICDIDFSRKYMMHGVKSLISSVQVTIKPNSISPSLILHYPCP